MMSLTSQIIYLFVIALPVACIAWTVTHEEIFREPREYCQNVCGTSKSLAKRKFFYLFTCEYCFSHYISLIFLVITQYKLLYDDWSGYLRQSLKVEKIEANIKDIDLKELENEK
jgi:glucan phosphoethanolaminetransferase (alkaline phosphatase superfamily)